MIEIQIVRYQDKPVLRNLLELCLHDYSEFNAADVDEHGRFGYPYLDHYWTDEGRFPLLVRVDGKLAGFVLVRRISPQDAEAVHSIAEFFILRKYRRQGIGRTVAHQVFDRFPGEWRVIEENGNYTAQAFWCKVIGEYTGGHYEEVHPASPDWEGPAQHFRSRQVAESGAKP